MSPLLIPLETRTLPGFPVAPDPGPLAILIYTVLIPVVIAAAILALGMGRHWLAAHNAPATTEPDGHAEVLPSVEQLQARRELVHQAAVHNEGRPDIPIHVGKSDPDPYHP